MKIRKNRSLVVSDFEIKKKNKKTPDLNMYCATSKILNVLLKLWKTVSYGQKRGVIHTT